MVMRTVASNIVCRAAGSTGMLVASAFSVLLKKVNPAAAIKAIKLMKKIFRAISHLTVLWLLSNNMPKASQEPVTAQSW
jgi:hypothetical protein